MSFPPVLYDGRTPGEADFCSCGWIYLPLSKVCAGPGAHQAPKHWSPARGKPLRRGATYQIKDYR